MQPAIRVDNLGKRYKIGLREKATQTFREALVGFATAPVRRFRTLSERASEDETIWALRDVSFEIQPGEVIGIIGRNGAGKTTLLKILSRITEPTEGRVALWGRVASLLEVGTGFHPELTGRENIYLNGAILGMKKAEINRRFDEIIAFAGTEKFLDTPVKRYSSGMRVRLAFAVAAHLDQEILLVDEVLAVGDAQFQKKCLGKMEEVARGGGRTVMFVSHNLAAVENLCPCTIWLDNGRIRKDGDSRSVIHSYLSTFAATQQSSAELRDVDRRKGSGEVRYTRIEFVSNDGKPLAVVRSGEDLVVRLHYRASKQVQHPHFGIEVYTNMGTLITSINTWTAGFDIDTLPPGEGHVDVHVESLNLIPDRYHLSLWLASIGSSYDRLDLCATLDVEAADVHHSGRKMDRQFGMVFFPCRWRHEASNEVYDSGAFEGVAEKHDDHDGESTTRSGSPAAR